MTLLSIFSHQHLLGVSFEHDTVDGADDFSVFCVGLSFGLLLSGGEKGETELLSLSGFNKTTKTSAHLEADCCKSPDKISHACLNNLLVNQLSDYVPVIVTLL